MERSARSKSMHDARGERRRDVKKKKKKERKELTFLAVAAKNLTSTSCLNNPKPNLSKSDVVFC